jgi:hypothetical protein
MGDEPPPIPDPDDWWASAATPTRAPAAPREPDEDWLAASGDEPSPRARRGAALAPRTRLLIAAAIGVLVLLVLGLALGGVFSSNAPAPAPPTTAGTTTARTTTTTSATTPKTPQTAAVVGPSVTVNPGASGTETTRLQRALVSLGHDPGPVDGSYGPLTAKGVEQFQRAAGLAPDGIFGPKTLTALTLALKRG